MEHTKGVRGTQEMFGRPHAAADGRGLSGQRNLEESMGTLRQLSSRKGFTLLELLMVVIIIAILASIALPQYIRASEKARASEALQLLGSIRSAQVRYRALNEGGVYTDNISDLDVDMPISTLWTANNAVLQLGNNGLNGSAVMFRLGTGEYGGQTLGITYGSGTLCGNFAPLLGSTAGTTCTSVQD